MAYKNETTIDYSQLKAGSALSPKPDAPIDVLEKAETAISVARYRVTEMAGALVGFEPEEGKGTAKSAEASSLVDRLERTANSLIHHASEIERQIERVRARL